MHKKLKIMLPILFTTIIYTGLTIQKTNAFVDSGQGYYVIKSNGRNIGTAEWKGFWDTTYSFDIKVTRDNTKNGFVGPCGSAVIQITVPPYATKGIPNGPFIKEEYYKKISFQYGQTRDGRQSKSKTFNGTYPNISFSARYSNDKGQTVSLINNGIIKLNKDGTPPKLTSIADDRWYRPGQVVTHQWTCSDSQSGCKQGVVSASGVGEISVTAEDNVCNRTTRTFKPKIDGTPPYKVIGKYAPAGWAKEKVVWGECGGDNGSGCDNGASYSRRYTVKQNGNHPVVALDKVGNQAQGSVYVDKIDRVAPSCNGIILPDGNYWYKTSFNVTTKCSDPNGSGCTQGQYTVNTTNTSGSIGIRDNVGWTNSCPYSGVKRDVTAPTTTIRYGNAHTSNSNQMQSSNGVEVIIEATDSQSGVDRICYQLDGATTQGARCVNGSYASVSISKEGNTKISAWSFDKARDYNASNNSGSYNPSTSSGGNRSATVTKDAYVDKTKPTISFASTNDGKTWSNKVTPVTVTIKDNGSGVGSYRYYWSTSSSNVYDESTALSRGSNGNTVTADISASWIPNKTFTETHPANDAHNDVIYLHVKACDRSYHINNCNTATYKTGIHFDNLKPETPTFSLMNQEWVNKFKLSINVKERVQKGKANSGLNTIYTYWDKNPKHMEDTYTRDNSTFISKANPTNSYPSSKYHANYNWTLDFANLKNKLKDGSEIELGAVEEGSRFIKVQVSDIAGNISNAIIGGPYKWDTSRPKANITDIIGDSRTFLPAESQ